jgi:hypothetical protein
MAFSSFAWLVIGLQVLALELYGVFSTARMDTVSEHYWWFRDRVGIPLNLAMTAFLIWLCLHFWLGNRPTVPGPR